MLLAAIHIVHLSQRLEATEKDVERLEAALISRTQEETLQQAGAINVTASAYSPRICETRGDPWETATQTRPRDGHTIAVSRDLAKKHSLLGKRVLIPGIGVRTVEDLMNARFRNSIDVFFKDTGEAIEFGRQARIIIPLE